MELDGFGKYFLDVVLNEFVNKLDVRWKEGKIGVENNLYFFV